MPRTSREVMADALREIDQTLQDIKRIIIDLADAQSEQRHHTRDAVDRLGTRVHELERRVANGGQ
jgi:polyhydroxyalkanoate synthesis regulator phasin